MRALTPEAGARVQINANVNPKATPIDAWLASSRSTVSFLNCRLDNSLRIEAERGFRCFKSEAIFSDVVRSLR